MTETFDAVLFDCDGVLVDSEAITNGVLCEMLNESGWALSPAQCLRIFIGKAVRSEARRIEQETGRPLTDEWMTAFYARRNARLAAELQPISGAVDTVRAIHALLGGRIACASGADRAKVEMQLAQVGMKPYFGPHVFSGHDLPAASPPPMCTWPPRPAWAWRPGAASSWKTRRWACAPAWMQAPPWSATVRAKAP